MYELKKNGKVFTSNVVGTGPSSYKKIIYRVAVSKRLRNAALRDCYPTLELGNQKLLFLCRLFIHYIRSYPLRSEVVPSIRTRRKESFDKVRDILFQYLSVMNTERELGGPRKVRKTVLVQQLSAFQERLSSLCCFVSW